MITPEQLAIRSLRNQAGWWEGDTKAERVLAAYRASVLAPIIAALSFDPEKDRTLEACARRLYHERDDLIRERNMLAREIEALHHKIANDLPPQIH